MNKIGEMFSGILGGSSEKESAKKEQQSEDVLVKFVVKKFNYNGIVYEADKLEAAAAAGDVDAYALIKELISIKSGVIEIVTPQ